VNGRIYLPSNTAGVEISRRTYTTIEPVMRYNAQGLPYLYDRLNQTDIFTVDLVADRLVRWLDWAELPEPARRYITMRASRSCSATARWSTTMHAYTVKRWRMRSVRWKPARPTPTSTTS
jgi:hypothetical protein